VYGKLRRSRRLDAVESGCIVLSIVIHGDLMVVANAGDSRVVLGTATNDGAITPSSSSST
jgi:serine/threonine protein phosphatase PrpC